VSALYAAEQTGEGRDVEISLMDTAYSMLTYLAAWNLNRGFEPARYKGSSHQTLVPVQTFRTADGGITIFCGKEKFWSLLCDAFEDRAMAMDERFASFEARFRNREAVVDRVQSHFLRKTTAEWIELLTGKVPCAPVRSIKEALADPELEQRGSIVEVEHPVFGTVKQVNTPLRFPESQPRQHVRAPTLGEHTEAVLREWLGYSIERIEGLRAARAI
jgi:crotonobetainyl-CoA:carnitine CoA-transferase CaiB-like acyl-CoA transferase